MLASGLAGRGHHVTAIVRAGGRPEEGLLDQRVHVDELPAGTAHRRRLIRVPSIILSLRRRLAMIDPDVVVAFKPENAVPALAAGVGKPYRVVVSERITLDRHKHYWHWRLGRRLLYRLAAVVVVQTDRSVPTLRQIAPAVDVQVIPNIVIVPTATSADSVWAPVPVAPGCRLITVARLAHQKGIDRLLDSFAGVAAEFPDWHLMIVGDGPDRSTLLTQSERLGLADRVTFAGTVVDPFPSLRDSDVFALASRHEGFPNALAEAMAVGLPVVAYDCPTGPGELITSGENGLLVADGDIEAFAEALRLLMADDALRRRLGARARSVKTRYAPDPVLDRWERVLRGSSV